MGRVLSVVGVLVVSLGVVGVSSALAVEHHPTGEYAQFKDCPVGSSGTELCLYVKTESGKFVLGKETIPIEKTITLQGGVSEDASGQHFVGAENGETLSKTPLNVPGGLLALANCKEFRNIIERLVCRIVFESRPMMVAATAELAGPASTIGINAQNLIEGEGTALSIPLKIHLENPLLGNNCYIGSDTDPLQIALTTGTTSPPPPNTPITGKVGHATFNPGFTIATIKENELVNNTFNAPAAEGCGGALSFLLDPIINKKLNLPAPSGHNTATLEGTLQNANAKAIQASEN